MLTGIWHLNVFLLEHGKDTQTAYIEHPQSDLRDIDALALVLDGQNLSILPIYRGCTVEIQISTFQVSGRGPTCGHVREDLKDFKGFKG
jgi:hypothetical protein